MQPVLIAGSAVKTEIGNFKLGSAVFIIVRSQKIESHMKQRYLQLQFIMVKSVQPFKNGHLSSSNVHLGKGIRFSCLALFYKIFGSFLIH